MGYSNSETSALLAVALESIKSGLEYGRPVQLDIGEFPADLTAPRASFVTLNQGEALRGCIGSLEAHTSLVQSVADNAYAAAFRDPRFPGLSASELGELSIQVSVLSPLVPVMVASEEELLTKMVPGEAGWVLQEERHRGTFLPSVWSSLAEPADFLKQLKVKAGLAPDYWSSTLQFWRYTTESFGDESA